MGRQRNLRRCPRSADREVPGLFVDSSWYCMHNRRVGQIQCDPQPILLVECLEHEIGVAKLRHTATRPVKPRIASPQSDQFLMKPIG